MTCGRVPDDESFDNGSPMAARAAACRSTMVVRDDGRPSGGCGGSLDVASATAARAAACTSTTVVRDDSTDGTSTFDAAAAAPCRSTTVARDDAVAVAIAAS